MRRAQSTPQTEIEGGGIWRARKEQSILDRPIMRETRSDVTSHGLQLAAGKGTAVMQSTQVCPGTSYKDSANLRLSDRGSRRLALLTGCRIDVVV